VQIYDPKRPHGLDDIITRMRAKNTGGPSWMPSWSEVERIQQYIGIDHWTKARETAGGDYALATGVLFHLDEVEGAWTTIAPYLEMGCVHHDAPAKRPCAYGGGSVLHLFHGNPFAGQDEAHFPLPEVPLVCTRRVLVAHGKIDATELFVDVPRSRPESFSSRQVLPINGEVVDGREICRSQYRHPSPLSAERLFVSIGAEWTIHDIRVADKSVLGPHRNLPGFAFGNSVMGPHLPLPVVEQDQWIEIEALRIKGDAPRFYGGIVGTRIE
jgi:hypothetical protein